MLNQVVLVGRLTQEPTIEKEDDKEKGYITLAVPRAYKNADGEYETDFIDCVLWNMIATNTSEYCHKGDIVGVKGRLQTELYEDEDGNKKKRINVIAEKVTFLTSKKSEETEEE